MHPLDKKNVTAWLPHLYQFAIIGSVSDRVAWFYEGQVQDSDRNNRSRPHCKHCCRLWDIEQVGCRVWPCGSQA